MLLHVPGSLDRMLSLFAGCFSQPTLQTFRAMVLGQICQTGQRTVCGMLTGVRLEGVWHHSRAHRFFSHSRWSPDELGLRLAELICERLIEPGAPVLLALDDTLLKRRGRRVHACHWHHDATANSRRGSSAWGNNWVVIGIIVRPVFLDRAICLPVLFRLWRPRRKEHAASDKPDPQRPSKGLHARQMVDLIAGRLADRDVHVVGDAAYATEHWRGLPHRVTITSRLRRNAAIYAPAPPRTGKRGRPATWGARLGTLQQIATDPATTWTTTQVQRYGKTEHVLLHEACCLWGPLGAQTPVRVVVVGDTEKPSGYQIALISTDLSSTPATLVARYADRWPIEVAYQDAKHIFGVGQAQNRTELAVQRTVPFQLLAMSITILWYCLHGHQPNDVAARRTRAPWYLTKTNPSTADMLAKLRRTIIAAQYHPGQGHTPTITQISQVQTAWAAAGY